MKNIYLFLIIFVLMLICIISQDFGGPMLSDNFGLDEDSWELTWIKSNTERQTIKLTKIDNKLNSQHSCYKAYCLGYECPANALPIEFCYPSIVITGLPYCETNKLYKYLSFYENIILMDTKEKGNCPFNEHRTHWEYFKSLPQMSLVTSQKLIIDSCTDITANMKMYSYLRQPITLFVVSFYT